MDLKAVPAFKSSRDFAGPLRARAKPVHSVDLSGNFSDVHAAGKIIETYSRLRTRNLRCFLGPPLAAPFFDKFKSTLDLFKTSIR